MKQLSQTIEIMLVESNPEHAHLTCEGLLSNGKPKRMTIATDSAEAISVLRKQGKYSEASYPHLILLELNLPRKDGHELLAQIKQDSSLRWIPVVILTTSSDKDDILKAYQLHANCYCVKPMARDDFIALVRAIEYFWVQTACLPYL